MKATFEDPAFVKHAGRFVWLAMCVVDRMFRDSALSDADAAAQ